MDKSTRVCVTGGSSYLGSWLVKRLLEKGYTVHATLRNLDTSEAAVSGLISIVRSCIKSGTIKRLIYTASVVAASPLKDCGYGFKELMDESCWTPLNLSFPLPNELLTPYTHSKTLSEKEVLRHMNGELEVVSIACGLVGGDSLLPTMPESMGVLISEITNHKTRYHCLRFLEELLGRVPIVHIEDVCEAHILCMEKPFNIGGRFLCACAYLSSEEIASHWEKYYPDMIIDEEFVEDLGREISWGSTKLKEIGFEYKFDAKMILDESLKCAQKIGEFVSSQQIMDDHTK